MRCYGVMGDYSMLSVTDAKLTGLAAAYKKNVLYVCNRALA